MRRTKPPVGWEHVRNCFPMPNELFLFDLSANALAVYVYLLYRADRRTGQCYPGMPTMASFPQHGAAMYQSLGRMRSHRHGAHGYREQARYQAERQLTLHHCPNAAGYV